MWGILEQVGRMSTDASLDARRGRQALGLPTQAQGGNFPRGCLSTPETPRTGKHTKHIRSCMNIAQRFLGRQLSHVTRAWPLHPHTWGGVQGASRAPRFSFRVFWTFSFQQFLEGQG